MLWFSFSTFAQGENANRVQFADSLFLKPGDLLLIDVVKVENSFVEYQMTGTNTLHFTSFHKIKKLVLANGQVYLPSEASYEQDRYERLGVNESKRKGHLLINTYLTSLVKRPAAENSLISLGAQYYFNSNISAGVAYQHGLGSQQLYTQYSYTSFINNVLDFNLGWTTANYRKFDFGIRIGYQITDISLNTSTIISNNLWQEAADQTAGAGVLYNGVFYDYVRSSVTLETSSRSESLPRFYVGGEMLYSLSPRFSASTMISFSNSNFLNRSKDEYISYDEYYNGEGTLVDRNLYPEEIYHDNFRLAMNFRITLSYHLFVKVKS